MMQKAKLVYKKYREITPDMIHRFKMSIKQRYKDNAVDSNELDFVYQSLDRLEVFEELKRLGWNVSWDSPREPEESSWATVFIQSGFRLDLYMRVDFLPEGMENQCRKVSLGMKQVISEIEIFDVICNEEEE